MGKPGRGHALPSRSECIAPTKRTGGSEPSQYPQEEKAKAIPSVAASERGRAPTIEAGKPVSVASMGVWGAVWTVYGQSGELQITSLAEDVWNDLPKRVIAP